MSFLIWSLFLLWPGYQLALPGYEFEFPRDHGNHPEFKLEWWYYTGYLETSSGRPFGYELTFFRTGLDRGYDNPSRWQTRDIFPAHFALTDIEGGQFHAYEKLNRSGPGIAGAASNGLDVWNENWSARMQQDTIHLRAAAQGIALTLSLRPAKPPVIHGRDGISRKGEGEGRASHYYSMSRLLTRGTLHFQGQELEVTGESWMDHEFGTNQLAPEQIGWDWFSLQLDEDEELMIFQIRRSDGTIDPHSAGTAIDRNGTGTHLEARRFSLRSRRSWTSTRSGGSYPLDWIIRIPSLKTELHVRALLDEQELVTFRSTGIAYWEGAVEVTGQWRGRPTRGRGYLEMTGYAQNSRPRI